MPEKADKNSFCATYEFTVDYWESHTKSMVNMFFEQFNEQIKDKNIKKIKIAITGEN